MKIRKEFVSKPCSVYRDSEEKCIGVKYSERWKICIDFFLVGLRIPWSCCRSGANTCYIMKSKRCQKAFEGQWSKHDEGALHPEAESETMLKGYAAVTAYEWLRSFPDCLVGTLPGAPLPPPGSLSTWANRFILSPWESCFTVANREKSSTQVVSTGVSEFEVEHSFVSHVVFSPCVQKRIIHGVAVGKRIISRKTVGSRTVILRSLSQVYWHEAFRTLWNVYRFIFVVLRWV